VKLDLGSLIAEWRKRPLARLGEAIDRLGGPLEVGGGSSIAEKAKAIAALAKKPRDPRAATALLQIVREVPWTSDGSRPAWLAIFGALDAVDDPRVPGALEKARDGWKIREGQRVWMHARANELLAAYAKRWPDGPPKPTPAEEKRLASIEAAIAPPATKKRGGESEEDLLAAVYANPDDDAPRSVYADWLQERGDPRGEFIALQLEKSPTKEAQARIRELLKKHERAWLGPIEPPVLKAAVVFRRGFVAQCVARFRHEHDARTYGALPAWGTVEVLGHAVPGTIPRNQTPFVYWIHPVMRALRETNLFDAPLDGLLGAAEPWRIERLTLRLVGEPARLEAIAASDKLPRLTSLHAMGLAPGMLARTSLFGRLRQLQVGAAANPKGSTVWLEEAASMPNLERFVLSRVPFERDAGRNFSIARIEHPNASPWEIKNYAPNTLTELTIVGKLIKKEHLPNIIASAKKQVHLERLDLTGAGGELLTFARKKKKPAAVVKAAAPKAAPVLERLNAVAWPSADRIVARAGSQIIVADVATGAWRSAGTVLGGDHFAASRSLVAISVGKTIHVRDLEKDREEASLDGHTDDVTALAFYPDGRRLVSAGRDRTLRVWEIAGARCAFTIKTSDIARGVAPVGGDRLVATSGPGRKPVLYGGDKPRVLSADRQHFVSCITDGRFATADYGAGGAHVFSPDGVEVVALTRGFDRRWMCLLENGRLAVSSARNRIDVMTPGSKERAVRIDVPNFTAAAAAPDGAQLAIAFRDRIEIWPTTGAMRPTKTIS
jgi:uncharacterized protein (TIGR02996 family)